MNRALFLPADILLPKSSFEKWAVIACDQYTSEPEYWEHVKTYVGEEPSALHIIFPEVYLSENNQERIAQINANMKAYLENGIFDTYGHTFVYTKRTLLDGSVRRGIVGMIDLEDYSCEKGSHTLIRATEETVAERVPPRVEIRQDALLEMPHVMLLIDDPERTVVEPLDEETEGDRVLYDFDLMQNGGHLRGIAVNERAAARIQKSLETLTERSEDGFLFAVGDGNHSLAAAKECYRMHPTESSRYALVEIVNIHDASLRFEPIYRVLFGVNPEDVIEDFRKALGGTYEGADAQRFTCVFGEKTVELSVKPTAKLAVGTLQTYLDAFLQKHPSAFIDYIHGEASVYELTKAEHTLGFLFEGMRKTELFPAIRQDGSLPRKTFSMGRADEKRFYLECRRYRKEYQTILFDLDGTLTDPKVGITKSVAYALEAYGIHVENPDELCKFIGPPLKESFMKYYGFDSDKAEEAVEKYREYFGPYGIFENRVYDGVEHLLKSLTACGKTVILATSKPTVFAKKILEHFHLESYFSHIIGSELDGTRVKKGDVIAYALEQAKITDKSQVVMVGDRKHDIIGAKENGLDAIGVLFGYGSRAELEEYGADAVAGSVEELEKILFSCFGEQKRVK